MEFDSKLNYKNKGWLSLETKNLWIIILSDKNRNCCQFFNVFQNNTPIFLPLNQNLFAKYETLENRLLYHFHFIPNLVPGHFVFNSNALIISSSVKIFQSLEIHMELVILKCLVPNIKQLNTSYSINISAYPTYTWKAVVAEAEAAGGKRNLRWA